MANHNSPDFDQADLLQTLDRLSDSELDSVGFGVIGFDRQSIVQRYGAAEQRMSGLDRSEVVGLHLFGVVAQCMNNFLVAQRYEDAAASGAALDSTINFVLTLRMRPTPVRLRLLSAPGTSLHYVCIDRRT